MKKIALLSTLSIVLACSGCTKTSTSLAQSIKDQIATVLAQPMPSVNRIKKYYAYYSEPSLGRYSSTDTGNVFYYQGTKFLMNLNVANIISDKVYTNYTNESVTNHENATINYSGTYLDTNEIKRTYRLDIYKDQTKYLVDLETDTAIFYGYCDRAQVSEVVAEMMKIARSMNVDQNRIINEYVQTTKFSEKIEVLHEFNEVVPESGAISELLMDTDKNQNNDQSTKNSTDQHASSTNQE